MEELLELLKEAVGEEFSLTLDQLDGLIWALAIQPDNYFKLQELVAAQRRKINEETQ